MTLDIDRIRHFDITVKRETIKEDMYQMYGQLFGDEVSRERVSIEELKGGYVNAIWKVSLKQDDNKSLIFRTFGMKFDEKEMAKKMADLSVEEKSSEEKRQEDLSLFDRLSEYKVMDAVSQHGLCKPVYCTYNNGYAYGYTRGVTLTGELMLTEDFLNEASSLSNSKNLIWQPQSRQLQFIDLEMSMANRAECDLGYLFGCYQGHFLYSHNKDLFPNEAYRRRFLRTYLNEFYKLNGLDTESKEFESELEDLFHKSNLTSVLMLVRWTGLGSFFDQNKEMFNNEDIAEEREKDKYFCGKYSLKLYRLFQEYYESFVREAEKHFAKRKQALA